MANEYSMKNWNVPAPANRADNVRRVPVYSASDPGIGEIDYFKPQMVEPKSYMRTTSEVARETAASPGERFLEKIGPEGQVHDINTREGRRGLAKDMGLPAEKKKKKRK
jgi:hypothetical protein